MINQNTRARSHPRRRLSPRSPAVMLSLGAVVLLGIVESGQAQGTSPTQSTGAQQSSPGDDYQPINNQSEQFQRIAATRARQVTLRAAAQPGAASTAPLTEAVLIGSQDGGTATARVGAAITFDNQNSLTLDTRLTNAPPDKGLPILSTLDGLSDGAEFSVGGAWVHTPLPEARITAFRASCMAFAVRIGVTAVTDACAVARTDAERRALAQMVGSTVATGLAFSVHARFALSKPSFEFRPSIDGAASTERHQQHAVTLGGSLLLPSSKSDDISLFEDWYLTGKVSIGKDWHGAEAQTLCSAASAATFSCQSIAVGAPFEQDVRTATLSARRYFNSWIAVAPTWSKRWAERTTGGLPGVDDGKWAFDLPLYFLKDTDGTDLTGGVAVSWSRGGGRRYAVFVGAALPAHEFDLSAKQP